MNRYRVFLSILLCVTVLLVSAIPFFISYDFSKDTDYVFPQRVIFAEANAKQKRTIYVCGAVKNCGYYTYLQGDTYLDVLTQAELLTEAFWDIGFLDDIPLNQTAIIVDYTQSGIRAYSINVNSSFLMYNDMLSTAEKSALALALSSGKITSMEQLKERVAQEIYLSLFYKLYVAEEDYVEAD